MLRGSNKPKGKNASCNKRLSEEEHSLKDLSSDNESRSHSSPTLKKHNSSGSTTSSISDSDTSLETSESLLVVENHYAMFKDTSSRSPADCKLPSKQQNVTVEFSKERKKNLLQHRSAPKSLNRVSVQDTEEFKALQTELTLVKKERDEAIQELDGERDRIAMFDQVKSEFDHMKTERDKAERSFADERDRCIKLEKDHRESTNKLVLVSEQTLELKREVFDLQLKIKKCKCGNIPQNPSDHTQPECDKAMNYHSLPESCAREGSGEVGQQYRSYQSIGASSPDTLKLDTWRKLHLEEELKKKDEENIRLENTVYELEQQLEVHEYNLMNSTCGLATSEESEEMKILREKLKASEFERRQKEEECALLKEKVDKQEITLKTLNMQETVAQVMEVNEDLNRKIQELWASQSEQVEHKMKLIKQHADDLAVKQQEIDALKREKETLKSKGWKLRSSHVTRDEVEERSGNEQLTEKKEQMNSLRKEKKPFQHDKQKLLEKLNESVSKDLQVKQQEIEKLQKEKESLQNELQLARNEYERKITEIEQHGSAQKQDVSSQTEEEGIEGEKWKPVLLKSMSVDLSSGTETADQQQLKKHLKGLKAKIAQMGTLEEKLFKLQDEKDAAVANGEKLVTTITTMCKQIEDQERQIKSLQEEKKSLKSEKQILEDSLLKHRAYEKKRTDQLQDQLAEQQKRLTTLQKELKEQETMHKGKLFTLKEKIKEKEAFEVEGKKNLEVLYRQIAQKNEQVQSLQSQLSNYPGQIANLKESAEQETMKLREELDAAKEEIDARIQHEVKITRELRASNEERSRLKKGLEELQDKCQLLQMQLEVNKDDFKEERKDRELAAGNYTKKEEKLGETITELRRKNQEQAREIQGLKEDLDEEQLQRGIVDGQLKDQLQSLQEVGMERDELKAEVLLVKDTLVANKKETDNVREHLRHSKQEVEWLQGEVQQLQEQNGNLARDIARKGQEFLSKLYRRGNKSEDHSHHGNSGEDTDMTIATLESKTTFLEEENKQLKSTLKEQKDQFQQLKQQSRREVHQLKQENTCLMRDVEQIKQELALRSTQTGVNHEARGYYGDQHRREVEDVDVTLRSENSHLKKQSKQQKKDFEHQYQVLNQKYHDLQKTVEELKMHIRELHDRLNQQAVSPRGPVDPHYPSEQDIKVPPGYTNRGDLTERDNYYPPDRRQPGQTPYLNPGSDSGHSDASRQNCDYRTPRSPAGHSPHVSPQVDRKHSKEGGIDKFVTNDGQFDNTPNCDGRIKDMTTDDTSYDDTSTFDLELSAGLPPPLHRRVHMSLSSDSDTSFQPNRRYIGDGINREIKQQAKHYKQGVQRGMPVADEVDEELWPYDPNLVCPHCGKRFRHGQIREFRYHIDDEHSPSMV